MFFFCEKAFSKYQEKKFFNNKMKMCKHIFFIIENDKKKEKHIHSRVEMSKFDIYKLADDE
jgi:hypothetical protein